MGKEVILIKGWLVFDRTVLICIKFTHTHTHIPTEVIEDADYTEWESDLDGSLLPRVLAARDMIESEGIVTNVKDS